MPLICEFLLNEPESIMITELSRTIDLQKNDSDLKLDSSMFNFNTDALVDFDYGKLSSFNTEGFPSIFQGGDTNIFLNTNIQFYHTETQVLLKRKKKKKTTTTTHTTRTTTFLHGFHMV